MQHRKKSRLDVDRIIYYTTAGGCAINALFWLLKGVLDSDPFSTLFGSVIAGFVFLCLNKRRAIVAAQVDGQAQTLSPDMQGWILSNSIDGSSGTSNTSQADENRSAGE